MVTPLAVSTVMGLAAPSPWTMALISVVAGLLTVTALNVIGYYVAIMTYRLDLDPDDHSIPLTSSSIDLVGTAFLILVIVLLGL